MESSPDEDEEWTPFKGGEGQSQTEQSSDEEEEAAEWDWAVPLFIETNGEVEDEEGATVPRPLGGGGAIAVCPFRQ